ncbi:1-acyl-sn-glycerol-3-phosphate acyltransferase [Microbacterium sp. CFBP9034]|uniref:1-acyl-sn-glycerol-3-phosphate acyltransferase n=1 Tax=Microbacterium sp. CFBP9034 TaxID=3096540 RepID=UPI002A6AD528|nr:1-acyl-sn-glycerol-3-phosphate acyltransferase [Microbacterium sp. CFBP9034]MDY0908044.1 1-acyl-sn-glycerol-3-phosphate acyltransferase [Microbacterium sp. CFBP9034]
MRLPPTWVRRVVLAPLVIVAAAFMVVLTPAWLILALALTSLVPGRFRLPRVVLLVTVYLVWDALLVLALFVVWVASGLGWKLRSPAFERAHYRLGGWALRVLFWVFNGLLRLTIVTAGSDGRDEAVARRDFERLFAPGAPVVVASRHAGPGDSFILVHTLLNDVARRPRIVLKYTMQWDPAVDVLLHRIPTRFIVPSGFGRAATGGGARVEETLADLATGLGADDAFVIFPEGGNFTRTRRLSRIARLRDAGREAMAERAEDLRNVMAPQPGGVHAALSSAPDADVVFVAHTGLEQFVTLRDMWLGLPMDKSITMRAWRVPRSEIPEDRDAQTAWLFDWFAQIDAWIGARRAEPGDDADDRAPETSGV